MKDSDRWDIVHERLHKEDQVHSQYAGDVVDEFPEGSIIAELGGGTGNDALYFLSKGHSVVLLDISVFALKKAEDRAKKQGLDAKLITKQCDFGLEKLPLKDNSIDIAYSRISLNYFDAERTSIILHDIFRILKPGGMAFLTFKSPEDEVEKEILEETASIFEPGVYIQGGQLRSRFSKEQLEGILRTAHVKEFKIDPYQEELPEIKGVNPVLYVNNVTFTKK